MRLFPRENYLKKIRACSGGHDHHGSVFGIVYVEQLLEPAWGAFLSRGFVDSHGFPFHALVLRARRA